MKEYFIHHLPCPGQSKCVTIVGFIMMLQDGVGSRSLGSRPRPTLTATPAPICMDRKNRNVLYWIVVSCIVHACFCVCG
jgi:hypothetical protein